MKSSFIFFIFLFWNGCMLAQNADIDILKSINLNRNKNLDNTFKGITNSVTPFSIAVPVGVLAVGLIKHDSTIVNKGLYISISLLLTAGITTGLKYSIKRHRPFVTYRFIDNAMYEANPSFPSGHTSDAFATATSLSLAFPKWYVIAPSYLWACSAGYSRMHLGEHYPSDVLAGAIVGTGASLLCYKLNQSLNKQRHKK